MSELCKICQAPVINGQHFRKHGLAQKEYYLRYWPRADLYDGTPIEFVSRDQYLATEFNSKTNMAAWLASAGQSEAEKWLYRVFKSRAAGWNFAPCSVELRSDEALPSLPTIEKVVGSYREFCIELGIRPRFELEKLPKVERRELKIAVDTREQKPLSFKDQVELKLTVGDYTVVGEGFSNVFIDRKAPADAISTFTRGYDRFTRELSRAKELGAYVVVLVEKPISFVRGFDKSYLKRFTQVTPKMLFGNIRKLLQAHENVQFLFVEETEAAAYVEKVLGLGEAAKNTDLQRAYEGRTL